MSHAVGVFGTPHRQIQGTPELHEQHEGKISRNNPYSFIRSNFLSIEVIGFLKPEKEKEAGKSRPMRTRTTCLGFGGFARGGPSPSSGVIACY